MKDLVLGTSDLCERRDKEAEFKQLVALLEPIFTNIGLIEYPACLIWFGTYFGGSISAHLLSERHDTQVLIPH